MTVAAITTAGLASAPGAGAAIDAPGLKVTVYTAGFKQARPGGPGPTGLAFLPDGRMLVSGEAERMLFHVPPGGGKPTPVTEWPADHTPSGIAVANGRTYVAVGSHGHVVEINPDTGRWLRVVASGIKCPAGLAVTPDGKDMFVSGLFCNRPKSGLYRVRNPEEPGAVFEAFGQVDYVDGVTVGPEGDVWVAHDDKELVRIAGPASPVAGAILARSKAPGIDGIVVTPTRPGITKSFAWGISTHGFVSVHEVGDLSKEAEVAVGGISRGDFGTRDAQGCLYATQPTHVLKITRDDGSCPVDQLRVVKSQILLPRKECLSRRVIPIRIRTWRNRRVISARVYVDMKAIAVRRSRGRLRANIDLRGRKKSRYTVQIIARVKGGQRISGIRRYKTCERKIPGGPPPL